MGPLMTTAVLALYKCNELNQINLTVSINDLIGKTWILGGKKSIHKISTSQRLKVIFSDGCGNERSLKSLVLLIKAIFYPPMLKDEESSNFPMVEIQLFPACGSAETILSLISYL